MPLDKILFAIKIKLSHINIYYWKTIYKNDEHNNWSIQRRIMQSSHDALCLNIYSNWFVTLSLQRCMHWVNNSIKLPSSGKTQTLVYLHSCELNTKFDLTVPSRQFLRLNVVFRQFIFVSSLVERRLYILPANRQILDKLDGVRFLFIKLYSFYSMVKEITLLKGNLCIYKCFIDV